MNWSHAQWRMAPALPVRVEMRHSYTCRRNLVLTLVLLSPEFATISATCIRQPQQAASIHVSDTRRLALNCVSTTKAHPLEMTA
jgi:hypothetical protein